MNETTEARIRQAVERHRGKADYLELRYEDRHDRSMTYRNGELIGLSDKEEIGANARALVDGSWGFVVFTDLERVDQAIEEAIENARLVPGEGIRLAPVEPVVARVPIRWGKVDPRDVTMKEKLALTGDYARLAHGFGGAIVLSGAGYTETVGEVTLATSEGSFLVQERFELGGAVHASAAADGETESGMVQFRCFPDFAEVQNRHDEIREACQLACDLLKAPRIEGGPTTVITDPYMTGTLVHEAFGHLSEADNFLQNPAMAELLATGSQIGSEILSIYDGPEPDGFGGSYAYDDEGVPARRTYLIEKGKIAGKLHTRFTAARLGEEPTGNARAISYRHAPIPRMRNTFIEEGTSSFDDLLEGVDRGLFAIKFTGGHGGENFTFTSHHGRRIENGKLGELVRGCTLSGNLFSTLKDIDCIARNRDRTNGGCGKGGQFPLMVGMGGPCLRIRNIQIGGA